MLSRTSKRIGRLEDQRSKRGRKAIAQMLEAMESRILMSTTDWLSVPTAELRQPTATAATQVQLEGFPAATVAANGSLQYTTSWVGNSYGAYPVTAPDGGTLMCNLVQQTSQGVAAGPVVSGSPLSLMAMSNGYSEQGSDLTIYQDGQSLSTNTAPSSGGGRGVAFSGSYVFQSIGNLVKASGIYYYTVVRFDLTGAASNIGATGQNGFGTNTISGTPVYTNDGKYIYASSTGGLQPNAIAYNSSTGNLYVTDNLDNRIYIFNASTGAAVNTGSYPSTGYFSFTNPYDMAIDSSGNLWITNQDPTTGLSDGKVYKYDQYGNVTSTTITGLSTGANCVAWDSHKGKLVVALGGRVGTGSGSSNTTAPILYYDVSSTPSLYGSYGTSLYSGTPGEMGAAKLSNISDIDVDAAGNLYVACASSNGGAGTADVRVLATPDLSTPTVGTVLYAECSRNHFGAAVPDPSSDVMYSADSYFTMNYNNAPGDQWTWAGITSDPNYTADIRNATHSTSSVNTPVVRHINGNTYMYLLGAGNVLEVYEQDASSDIFRPVSIISIDAKGDPAGTGTFPGYEPTSGMWIWTDGNGDGISQSGEFATISQTAWAAGMNDLVIDANGDVFFSVGKADGTAQTGPAIVEMKCTGYNSYGSPIYQWGSNTIRALLPSTDPQWGTQSNGKANVVGGLAYDSVNKVMYVAGGPIDAQGGMGMVLRAYSWDASNPPTDLSTLGTPTWSIQPPWIVYNSGSNYASTMTTAGDYVFVESRCSIVYVYNRSDGSLAGQMFQSPVDSKTAFPDNFSAFQAVQRTNGDILLTTEGFYSEQFYRLLAAGNHSPTVSFSQNVQTSLTSPTTVTFNATAGDPDGDALTYTWQFGDGTFDRTNSPTVTHTYTYNGGFTVDLAVHDTKGGAADAASLVTVGPAGSSFTVAPMAVDMELDDVATKDSGGVLVGICDVSTNANTPTVKLGGNTSAGTNDSDLFPFDLWAAGLMPQDHVSTSTLPTLSFVLSNKYNTPASADLYAVGMFNTLNIDPKDASTSQQTMGNLYYAGTGDTRPGMLLLQQNFLTSSSTNGTRYSINSTAQQALANYINAASDAGYRYIMLRLSPQVVNPTANNYYKIYTSDSGSNAPQLSVTTLPRVAVSNATSYSVLNNALAVGMSQYGDAAHTFTTIPGKYLSSTYIRTAYNDRNSSTGSLSFTINQSATVYVLYDDALASHKPSWLTSGFTDTGDNIVSTAGTFSVYKSNSAYSAGTVTLGANTSDSSTAGAMYSVLVTPSLPSGLVGWWKFEEGTGASAADSAPVTADNGTVSGSGPVWGDGYLGNTQQFDINLPGSPGSNLTGAGLSGNALYFNGKDNYVTIADSNNNLHPANITVSCWARSDLFEKANNSRDGWVGQSYLAYSSNFYIKTLGGDVQTVVFGANTSSGWKTYSYTPAARDPGQGQPLNNFNVFQWHQYGLTYNGSTLTAYVDGVAVGTVSGGSLTTTASPVIIGGDGTANFFKGYIDDVRLYNTALSAANMQAVGDLGAGIQTVTGMPTAVGASTALSVTSLTPALAVTSTLNLSTVSNATAGAPFTITVTAKDSSNNTATGYTGTVHFTSSDGQVSAGSGLPSDYTFLASDNGVKTFTSGVTLKTAGSQTVTATSTLIGTITGYETTSVSPATASTLSVSAPGSATTGTPISVTVTAKDAYSNNATGYTGTVRFTSTDGAASLPANYTFVSGDNGVHTFTNGVTLNTAGNQTVTATDTVTGTITGTSGTIIVTSASTTVTITPTANATEGGANGTFTVTRVGTSGNLTVNYSIGGSATNGTDYTSLPGTVTILNGSSTATITVAASNDGLAELTETVDLTLTSGTGYNVGSPNQATVTIANAASNTVNFLDSANLVGYWRLDEGSGTTAYDLAPSGGTADTGAATASNWGTGRIGNAYHANNASTYDISVPNSSDITPTNMTLAAWVKNDTGVNWGSTKPFLFKNASYQMVPSSSTSTNVKFGVDISGTWYYVTAGPSDVSQWHHYAMTYNGTTLTAYIDGSSVGSTSVTGSLPSNSGALYIGGGNVNAFSGYIDEVRLYNTAISAGDISTLATQSAPSVTAVQGGLVVSNLQSGNLLYSDAGNTLSTIPGRYLGSTQIKTASASANSTGDKVVGLTVNQNSIVYVLYDDAISSSHRADATGGWLSSGNGFTDTGDNITDSSGHTFSVYKSLLSTGTIWLGGNTLDGINGTGLMYDVLVQPLL